MKKLLKILLATALATAPSMAVISWYKAKPKDDIHEELIEDSNIHNDIEEVINNLHHLHQINKHLEVLGLFKDLLGDQDKIQEEKELDEEIESITVIFIKT